jgi:hypothetical protein
MKSWKKLKRMELNNINENILKMLGESYGKLTYYKENIYKSKLHTLRFYNTLEERDKSIDTINSIYKNLQDTNKDFLPISTLAWLSPPTFVAVYSMDRSK